MSYYLDDIKHKALNRTILAVVKKYINENPQITYEQLKQVFPKELQGSIGVIKNEHDYKEYINNTSTGDRRFFTDEILQINNDKIYVCTEWGGESKDGKEGNKTRFFKHVINTLKYKLEEDNLPDVITAFKSWWLNQNVNFRTKDLLNKLVFEQENDIFVKADILKKYYSDKYPNENKKSDISSIFSQNTTENSNKKIHKPLQDIMEYKNGNKANGLEKIAFKVKSEYFEDVKKIITDNPLEKIKNKNSTGSSMKEYTSSHNQILYGPPGTGKTYNTINKALEIILEEELGEEYTKLQNDKKEKKLVEEATKVYESNKDKIIIKKENDDRELLKQVFEYYKKQGQIEFVTFHQSYGYEEFVEGIKAKTSDKGLEYEVEAGILKKLSKIAAKNIEQTKENATVKKDFDVIFKEKILDKLLEDEKLEIKMKKSSFYIKEVDATHISLIKAEEILNMFYS